MVIEEYYARPHLAITYFAVIYTPLLRRFHYMFIGYCRYAIRRQLLAKAPHMSYALLQCLYAYYGYICYYRHYCFCFFLLFHYLLLENMAGSREYNISLIYICFVGMPPLSITYYIAVLILLLFIFIYQSATPLYGIMAGCRHITAATLH